MTGMIPRVVTPALGALCLCIMIALVFTQHSLRDERADHEQTKIALAIEREAKSAALDTVAKQNAQIEQIEADGDAARVTYETELKRLSAQATASKTHIVTELQKDPSCEREMQLIYEQLAVLNE